MWRKPHSEMERSGIELARLNAEAARQERVFSRWMLASKRLGMSFAMWRKPHSEMERSGIELARLNAEAARQGQVCIPLDACIQKAGNVFCYVAQATH